MLLVIHVHGHNRLNAAPLFRTSNAYCRIRLLSLAEIKKNKSDSIYFSTTLRYKRPSGYLGLNSDSHQGKGKFSQETLLFSSPANKDQ